LTPDSPENLSPRFLLAGYSDYGVRAGTRWPNKIGFKAKAAVTQVSCDKRGIAQAHAAGLQTAGAVADSLTSKHFFRSRGADTTPQKS
jgi:hypothetical protein